MLRQPSESKFTHLYVKINQDEYNPIVFMTFYFDFKWLFVNVKVVI